MRKEERRKEGKKDRQRRKMEGKKEKIERKNKK